MCVSDKGTISMVKVPKEQDPKLTDYSTMFAELEKLPDSAYAITAAAILDEKLKLVLAAFLVSGNKEAAVVQDLMLPERALGSFGSRTRVSFVLGIISENEYEDLKAVGSIRDKFAHGLYGLTFSEQAIADKCWTLRLGAGDRSVGTRYQFFSTFVKLLSYLSGRAVEVSHKPYKRFAWPDRNTETGEEYIERVFGHKWQAP